MDKDILQLFSISDSDIIISDYFELGICKYITVEKKPGDTHTCPECGCNMRFKGIYMLARYNTKFFRELVIS